MKNRSLKTCNDIPLFSFPQMTLSAAGISDATEIDNWIATLPCTEQPKARLHIAKMAV